MEFVKTVKLEIHDGSHGKINDSTLEIATTINFHFDHIFDNSTCRAMTDTGSTAGEGHWMASLAECLKKELLTRYGPDEEDVEET